MQGGEGSASNSAPSGHAVSVTNLCSFTAKAGDLDHRFTPSPSAQEGIAGHRIVVGRRRGALQTEVALQGSF